MTEEEIRAIVRNEEARIKAELITELTQNPAYYSRQIRPWKAVNEALERALISKISQLDDSDRRLKMRYSLASGFSSLCRAKFGLKTVTMMTQSQADEAMRLIEPFAALLGEECI